MAEFSLMMSRLKRQPTLAMADEARALYIRRERKPIFGAVLAYALARLQQVDESLQLISDQLDRTAQRTAEHLYLVFALVELGRIEQAAGIVQAVFDRGCGLLPMVLSDPVLAPLLQHPAVARIQASFKARVPAA